MKIHYGISNNKMDVTDILTLIHWYQIANEQFIILIKNNCNIERGGWGPYYNNFFEVWTKNIKL